MCKTAYESIVSVKESNHQHERKEEEGKQQDVGINRGRERDTRRNTNRQRREETIREHKGA